MLLYYEEFGEDVFSTDVLVLFCNHLCGVKIASEKKL